MSIPNPNENSSSINRKLRILGVPANAGGCAYYRCLNPLKVLQEEFPDKVEVRFNENPLMLDTSSGQFPLAKDLEDMNWADVILISNILKFGGPYTARVVGIGKELNKFVHFDTDDLLTGLYKEHKLFGVYKEHQLDEITKSIYYYSDLVTVTQSKFAERIKPFVRGGLAILKNAIDYNLPAWNAPRATPKYTRIGWAAGIHHKRDVEVIKSVPHLVNQKVGRENVKWDFYGAPPPDPRKPKDWQEEVWPEYRAALLSGFKGQKNWQIHYALPPDNYGIYIANMDVSIAPLEMNDFNDSKSEIKVAEAGRYKIPLVASDVGCYNEIIKNGVNGYLIDPKAPKSEWVRILTKLCKDKDHRIELGENLHKVTEKYFNQRTACAHRLEVYRQAFQHLGYSIK